MNLKKNLNSVDRSGDGLVAKPFDSAETPKSDVGKRNATARNDAPQIYRTFRCFRCRTEISVEKNEVGTAVVCLDCETSLVVPDYLDFTETDEERRRAARFTAEKRRRDELISPLKNPNRTGLETELRGVDVYSLEENLGKNRLAQTELFPVYCRVCQTLLQASRERLGLPIRCPDCGAETIATTAVRDKIRAREAESIVAVPDPKTTGPALRVEAEPKKPKFRSARRKDVDAVRRWRRLKLAKPDENLPLVLRRRDDGFVWALASPPKRFPMFNDVWRPLGTVELWARGGLLAAFLFAVSTIVVAVFFPAFESFFPRETLILAIAASATQMLAVYVWSILSTYFVSIYIAGNTGSKKVVDWLDNGFWSDILFGAWLFSIAATALAPGGIVATLLDGGTDELIVACLHWKDSTGVTWRGAILRAASFCVFFPIFFLSTLQKDWFFAPICKEIATSWGVKMGVWIQFLVASTFCVGVPLVVFFRFIDDGVVWRVGSFVAPLIVAGYALLLGRLSWILDDEIRWKDF